MTVRYYVTHLVKGGAKVPLMLWFGPSKDPETGEDLDRSPVWHAVRNGHEVPIDDVVFEYDPRTGEPVIVADTIDEREYLYLDELNAHARAHNHDAPEARPRDPIDLNALPPLF